MVSARQTVRVAVDREWCLGATDLKPLLTSDVAQSNGQGDETLQVWGTGTIKSFVFGAKRYTIDVDLGPLAKRHCRINFLADTLMDGSQILPPGTPVHFQSAFHPGKGKETGSTEIVSLKYNEFQYSQHAGSFPSTLLLDNVVKALGFPHIVLGCPSLVNPCGVSFLDLVKQDDSGPPLDQISFDSLLLKGLEVLKSRLEESSQALETKSPSHDPTTHACLVRTIEAKKNGDNLVVFIVPGFHPRKTWIHLVNCHLNNQAEGAIPICKVRILEKVSSEMNAHNTARETGLLSRHADSWRVNDFQESYQLFPNSGPFARLKEGGKHKVEERCPEHHTYLVENITDHLSQLLVVSLSPHTPSLLTVPCTLIEEADTPSFPDLGSSRLPSFLLVYPRAKEEDSHALVEKIMENMLHNDLLHYAYPDTRKVAVRLTLREADSAYMNEVITNLNDTGTSVVRAGLWDELHQNEDDQLSRTVLCKSGFTPDQTILLHLDPKIQFRMIQQGILRIYSQLPTDTLVGKMRGVNTQSKSLERNYSRGERNPFQAIVDGNGLTWVGSPASAPLRKDKKAWMGRVLPRTILAPTSPNRIIITGPALNWTDEMVRTVLSDLGVGDTARDGAYWATKKGQSGTFMVIDHPSVVGIATATKQYRGFIIVELSHLTTDVSIFRKFDVFRPIPPRSSHEVRLIVDAAKEANTLGTHQLDPNQENLIASIGKANPPPPRSLKQLHAPPRLQGETGVGCRLGLALSLEAKLAQELSQPQGEAHTQKHTQKGEGERGTGLPPPRRFYPLDHNSRRPPQTPLKETGRSGGGGVQGTEGG
jgi:hypothetical protein